MTYKKRSDVKHYIKIASAYHLIGPGVISLDDSLNPGVETEQYIMDTTSTTTIDRYDPSWAITMRVSETDPVSEFIRACGQALSVGSAAETTMVVFDAWDISVGLTVPALEYKVAVAVDYISNGEAGSKLEMSAVLHAQGSPKAGTFSVTPKTFAPAT